MMPSLQSILKLANPPEHADVGEVFLLHQSLAEYYFLKAKCTLYVHHGQSEDLKEWWHKALQAVNQRIQQITDQMEKMGAPLPPSLATSTELTDQFMAVDGMAMVKGLLLADALGLQSTRHPTLALLYQQMAESTMRYSADLNTIMEKEGWVFRPPTYSNTSPGPN